MVGIFFNELVYICADHAFAVRKVIKRTVGLVMETKRDEPELKERIRNTDRERLRNIREVY